MIFRKSKVPEESIRETPESQQLFEKQFEMKSPKRSEQYLKYMEGVDEPIEGDLSEALKKKVKQYIAKKKG